MNLLDRADQLVKSANPNAANPTAEQFLRRARANLESMDPAGWTPEDHLALGAAGSAIPGMGGAMLGGALGSVAGGARGNTAEGLGRGIIRGGATGVGMGLGTALGNYVGSRTGLDPKYIPLMRLIAPLLGGGAGYYLSGKALGPAAGRAEEREKYSSVLEAGKQLLKQSDREDKLLSHMQSKGNMDKGKAVAIAKSRGWVRQSGKHLELTSKGEGPRANVDKPESEEKAAVHRV